jgi:hypothetical protein
MQNRKHFRHGRNVFACEVCGRQTRDAGDNSNSNCCPECYELAGWQNAVFDGVELGEIAPERDRLVAKAVNQGSDEARIRREFPELFPEGATPC